MTTKHEIWARTVLAAVDMAKQAELSLDGMFDGLSFDAQTLHQRKRVPWDDYCVVIERICERTPDIQDLLEASYHNMWPELRTIAGAVIGPKQLYWFIADVGNAIMFPPVAHRFEELPDRRIRITCQLRDGARPCEALFRSSIGAWRGVSRHLGLPAAKMISTDISPTRGEYELELPASNTIVARTKRAVALAIKIVLGHEHDGVPLTATIGDPRDPPDARFAQATDMWKLTPRQADVLAGIVHGDSNTEIAQSLGCTAQTVELHVVQLLRRVGVTSRAQLVAVFWSGDWGFAG